VNGGVTLRRGRLRLPVAPIGPDNPLPPLRPPVEVHRLDNPDLLAETADLPDDMARQIGYGRLTSLLPCRIKDGYGRRREPAELDALVLENDHLRATVLPGLGGRLWSLEHRGGGLDAERELLYRNPVLQPANLGLTGAWFAGGVEWNLGSTGHTTLTCEPVFAGRVDGPGGTPILRLWEWERTRDLPFQVDLWLPPGGAFLYAGVRVRNPHGHEVPVYWWSNAAVPQTPRTRVLAPARTAWHFGYERRLRRVPVPEWDGLDRSYPARARYAADYFYELAAGQRRWIASLDEGGRGLVQTSTDSLRGRKLFLWGTGPGGRRWQDWLGGPGAGGGGGYLEIQAGLARTQLEHLPLPPGAELSWLEAYGPLAADPATVRGGAWDAAVTAAGDALERALPRARVDAAHDAWRRELADREPAAVLAAGSGWGALEVARAGYTLPGTPFGETGPAQRPWRTLLHTGTLPAGVTPDESPDETPEEMPEETPREPPAGTRDGAPDRSPAGCADSPADGPADDPEGDPGYAGPAKPEHGEPAKPEYGELAKPEYGELAKPEYGELADSAYTGLAEPDQAGLPGVGWREPPGPGPVSAPWRELLEAAPDNWLSAYHRGLARWHAGDRVGAVAAWELSRRLVPTPWAARNLAVADAIRGRFGAAADRLLAAMASVAGTAEPTGPTSPTRPTGPTGPTGPGGSGGQAARPAGSAGVLAALAREAAEALLAARRPDECLELLAGLPERVRNRGRFRLLEARALLDAGDRASARAILDAGFDLPDLRESSPELRQTWTLLTDDPLPSRYDFRVHPAR
jgi:hypothetical protein